MFDEKPSYIWSGIKDEIKSLIYSLEKVETSTPETCQKVLDWTKALKDMHNSVIEILIAELKKEMK